MNATCPHCGHVHSTDLDVFKIKKNYAGTKSHNEEVTTCKECEKRFIMKVRT